MQRKEVEAIFEERKDSLFEGIKIYSNKPVAIILGGQPSCGKSTLINAAKKDYNDLDFLIVNGDLYRQFHPEYNQLIKDPFKFSTETQIFSNVFTEKLIEEAIKYKCNIIVEGTMRNPDVPIKTANLFKAARFNVDAYVIAAPDVITQLGIYSRFQEEINKKGIGRLADVASHNNAVTGLTKSIDTLYNQKCIDKIYIHSYLSKDKIKDFILENNSWNCNIYPSVFINEAREKQLQNKNLLQSCIVTGKTLIKDITEPKIKSDMQKAINQLELMYNNIL